MDSVVTAALGCEMFRFALAAFDEVTNNRVDLSLVPVVTLLPGLVSQSVILWDRVCLEWTRVAKGRTNVRLLATV